MVASISILSLPVWAIGTLVVAVVTYRNPEPLPALAVPDPGLPRSRGPYVAALVMIAALLPALPATQAEQSLRYDVERALHAEDHDAAIELLMSRPRTEFPPNYRPSSSRDGELQKRFDAVLRHWGIDVDPR
jgi:hypothetical protein